MRSMWKGVVSFGLVSIPVKLYAATEEHDVPLRMVHATDGSRIRFKRVCEAEGVEVPYGEIARGYELSDGQMIVLTEDDLAALPLASSRNVDVLRFVPADQIDGIYLAKSYYLEAEGAGAKPYVLLRDALTKANTVALVKVALRQRESLAILRPLDNVLVMQTMLWPDEIRDPSSIAPPDEVTVRAQEMQMANSYINTLTGDFEPDEYSDEYATALRTLVTEKEEGHEIATPPAPAEEGGQVIDLMAALEASVAAAKEARGEATRRPKAQKRTAKKATKQAKKKTGREIRARSA